LSITAASVGSSTDSLDTDVANLTLSITGAAYVNEANTVTVNSATVVGDFKLTAAGATALQSLNAAGNVTVTLSAGDLTLGNITASNHSVNLNVAGAVVGGDAVSDITAQTLDITAASVGSSSNSLSINVVSLSMNVSGAAILDEVNALSVNSAKVGGSFMLNTSGTTTLNNLDAQAVTVAVNTGGLSVSNASAAGLLSLTSAGPTSLSNVIALSGMNVTVNAGDLSLNGVNAAGQSASLNVAGQVLNGGAGLDLTAQSLSITAAGVGQGMALDTEVAELSLSVSGGAMLSDASGLMLSTASVGSLSLTAAGHTLLQSLVSDAAVSVVLTAGDLTVGSVLAYGQAVSLNVAGAVLDGDAGVDVSSQSLNITAGSIAASSDALDLDVASLTLSVTGDSHLNEANTLTVTRANVGLLSLSTGGAAELQSFTAQGSLSVTVTIGDLTVDRITAIGQSVSLNVAGSVTDGDDAIDITAQSLNITANAVGSATDALEIEVAALSLNLGAGGAFLSEADGLTVTGSGIASAGQVSLVSAQGDVQLDAALSFSGSASLNINAVSGSVSQSATSTIRTEQGNVSVLGQTGASVSNVSTTSGQIGVKASEGAFVVPQSDQGVSYGDQPVRIQGTDVSINAPLSGTGTLELSLSSQSQAMANLTIDASRVVQTVGSLSDLPLTAPIVLGDAASGQTAMRLDASEIGLLADGFERIVIGSQDPTQVLWLGAPTVNGVSQPLVFKDPLVLVASGMAVDANGNKLAAGHINISGGLFGQGLTILGSGSTTELKGGYIRQAGDVLISDNLIIEGNTTIEVSIAHGVLDVRGSILVKSGATLTLLASDLRLGTFGDRKDSVVLQAGATLVLGAQSLTVDTDLTIDGAGVGALVLRGSQINGQAQDFDLSVQQLDLLTVQLVDASFADISVGMAGTNTTVRSPSLWSEQARSVVMAGGQVHLGAASENAQWQISSDTRFVAVSGDLQLHADLLSGNRSNISLQAGSGQVRMAANSEIRSEGAVVTVKATNGIEVGRIDTSSADGLQGAVALDSAGGRIVLADTYTASQDLGVSAQSVSFFGYGQAYKSTDGDRVLRVESERLQVSAPTGVSSRGLSTGGVYYRLMDQGTAYAQLLVTGQAPERVMLPVSEVAGNPLQAAAFLAVGAAPTSGFVQQLQSRVWTAPVAQASSVQARAYLAGPVHAMVVADTLSSKLQEGWILLNELVDEDEDLLSDLAYGFSSESEAPSFVMGLPGLQPASSGLLPSNEVLFDYLVQP
jgi:hypothetical protein